MNNLYILKNNVGTFGKYLMLFNIIASIILLNLDPTSYLLNAFFEFLFSSATIIPLIFRPLEKNIYEHKDLYINYIVYPTICILTMSWIGLIMFPDQKASLIPLELKKMSLYSIYFINLFALFLYYLNVYFKYLKINQYKRILYEFFILIAFIGIGFLAINNFIM